LSVGLKEGGGGVWSVGCKEGMNGYAWMKLEKSMCGFPAARGSALHVQGYLAHTKQPPT